MKALITGVAGFVGSHLAEKLLAQGISVSGIDSFTDYYPRILKEANLASLHKHQNFHFQEESLQTAALVELLSDVTHVYHLAAQAGVRKSWGHDFSEYITCNIEATQILLEACRVSSLERVVYASSSSVYGDVASIPMQENVPLQPLSPYGVTKLAAEHLCHLYWENYGVPTVSLRYFTVYGPRQRPDMAFNRFLKAILTGEPITLFGNGEQTRDFTFIEDIISATTAAGTRGEPGRVYNIGGGSRVSMNHVIKLMNQCTNREPIVVHQERQKGDMRDTYADTTLAQTDLGFEPSVTLEEGIKAEFEWLSENLSS
tara:strand:- start:2964 stop:3908 length:945 start_codon:yes stop_codon:yes gene_type:complete